MNTLLKSAAGAVALSVIALSAAPPASAVVKYGDSGNNTIVGTSGDDDLYGKNGNDRLYGSAGNDYLLGGKGADYLSGGSGADRIQGGGGRDTLTVVGNDAVHAGYGNDTIRILDTSGDASIYCGEGYDRLYYPEGGYPSSGTHDCEVTQES